MTYFYEPFQCNFGKPSSVFYVLTSSTWYFGDEADASSDWNTPLSDCSMMDIEMDDGNVPEICDQGALDFVPQRRSLCNRLLPYSDQLDQEIVTQLSVIKKNLAKALLLSDVDEGAVEWVYALHRFIKLYSFCFSKEDHIHFIKILYELVIAERQNSIVTVRFAQTLLLLLKKVSLLTPDDIELGWRPLYDLTSRLFRNAAAFNNMLRLPGNCESTIYSVVRHCRSYFPPGSTEEILEEFLPHLCPFDDEMSLYIRYFEMFIPVTTRHNGNPPKHHLWRPVLLDLIENSPYWEAVILQLLSRLAYKNIGLIDWEDQLPLFFTKILKSFRLPVSYPNSDTRIERSFEVNSIGMFVVANLGGGSATQSLLTKLVGVVESYLHPSNNGHWTRLIMDTFSKITLYFNKRYNRERRQADDSSWDAVIPQAKKLTEEDIDAFVDCLLGPCLTAIFGKMFIYDAATVLGRLATLRPSRVMPKFLEMIYPALESCTEPERLTACLLLAKTMSHTLLTGGTDYPEGRKHVLPILKLLLPGIDHNDCVKAMGTFSLIALMFSYIPVADCSAAIGQMNLTDVEVELCQQSAEFQDYLIVLLERCFSLVESCISMQGSVNQQARDVGSSSNMSAEEMQLESGIYMCLLTILDHCHPDIAKVLVERIVNYAMNNTLEVDVSGRLFGSICRAASQTHPDLMTKSLLPRLCNQLVRLTSTESALNDETPDSEIMFKILVLKETLMLRSNSPFLEHFPVIVEALKHCLKVRSIQMKRMAMSIYSSLLNTLSTTRIMEERCVPFEWTAPLTEFLPIRHWGALINGGWSAIAPKWQEPGEEQKKAIELLFNTFLLPELSKLDRMVEDMTLLDKDELQHSLYLVQESLAVVSLLPFWTESQIDLSTSNVDTDSPQLVLSSNPISVEFNVEGRASNVRKAVVDTILRLGDSMLLCDSDNTKAYEYIITILWTVQSVHAVRRTDFDRKWKTFILLQRTLRNNMLGPNQYWYKMRRLMLQRAYLQHCSRTVEAMECIPFTTTNKLILDMSLRFSTSNYSGVRRAGQRLMYNLFQHFPTSVRLIVDPVLENLKLDPVENHKIFKGTMFILLGVKAKGIFLYRDWSVIAKVWPAVIAAKHSEKPSIIQLFAMLQESLKYFDMMAIVVKISDGLLSLGKKLCTEWNVDVSEGEIERCANKLKVANDNNLANYSKAINSLVNIFENENITWRYEHLTVCMLSVFVRVDVEFPHAGVRALVNSLIHSNIYVRTAALNSLKLVLRSQKRKHLKMPFDPYTFSKTPVSPPKEIKDYINPGMMKPENCFLQYDPDSINMTLERYEERRYMQKTYTSFMSWSKSTECYAPPSKQPTLHRSFEELSEGEKEVFKFFSNEGKVETLINYLTLDDKKPENEKFEHKRMWAFQGLARNFGVSLLNVFKDHILRLSLDNTESKQRCCAEMTAGFVRGSKHWVYEDWKQIMELATTIISNCFTKLNPVTVEIWYNALMRISMDRDPNLLAPILELLIDIPDLNSTSPCTIENRFHLYSAFIHQQEWRCVTVLEKLSCVLKTNLSHPYKAVRDKVALLLFNCYNQFTGLYSTKYPFDNVSSHLNLDSLVDHILEDLGSLREISGGNNTGVQMLSVTATEATPQDHLITTESPMVAAAAHLEPMVVGGTDVSNEVSNDASNDSNNNSGNIISMSESMMEDDDSRPIVDNMARVRTSPEAHHTLPLVPFDSSSEAGTAERKRAFQIVYTSSVFLRYVCNRVHCTTPKPFYKLIGALCQLESVDSDQDVRHNCVDALSIIGQNIIRMENVNLVLDILEDICINYSWWRARKSALGVLLTCVFYNSLLMMTVPGVQEKVLQMVLARLEDQRVEVRVYAAKVLSSLLHISFVQDRDSVLKKFLKKLQSRKIRTLLFKSKGSALKQSDQLVPIHGAILGLTAYVNSAPYTIPTDMPNTLCSLADYINLPDPIGKSVRECISSFKRTHYDNWQEHKMHFDAEQLDILNDLLLSPSYYA